MFQKRDKSGLGWLIVGVVFWLTGCGGGTPPPPPIKEAPPKVAVKKEGGIKPADRKEPPEKEEPEYQYHPIGKPDPFKPFIELTPVRERVRTVPRTPLQKYDISQLKLVAIISAPEGNIALVEDATGKGYFVRKGTEIGKNEGKVTKILKDRLIIEELFEDVLGKVKKSEIQMMLHQTEEGGES